MGVRRETTRSLKWIAEHPAMGSWTHVSNLLNARRKRESLKSDTCTKSRGFVRPQKFVAIEMNQVVRGIGNPHFGFPRDIRCKLAKGVAVEKCGDENDVRRTVFGQPL